MTDDAWFGITPEPAAMYESTHSSVNELVLTVLSKIAEHLAQRAKPDQTILIDAFAGTGGNTIAFALSKRWKRIIAIEKEPDAVYCGKTNADIYGVGNRIEWVTGDCFKVLESFAAEDMKRCVIFASPPWGGETVAHDDLMGIDNCLQGLDIARTRCSTSSPCRLTL